MTAIATAIPPPRGVGTWCELRSFGTSSNPRVRAKRSNPQVNAESQQAADDED